MNSMRLCILEGNLVKDPVQKVLDSGKEVALFTLAANHFGKTKEESVSYFDVEVWNESARDVVKTLKKGFRVKIYGDLKQERWEKDGKMNSKIKIVADSLKHIRIKNTEEQEPIAKAS